jgi:hypothetical protein
LSKNDEFRQEDLKILQFQPMNQDRRNNGLNGAKLEGEKLSPVSSKQKRGL